MALPKVLIFTVTYEGKDYAFDKFITHANAINYPNCRHIWIDNSSDDKYYRKLLSRGLDAYRVERGSNTREAIARAQNFARKKALDEGYDYVLSLESDVLVPPDIIQLLLRHGLDIVGALYFIGNREEGVRCPCITMPEWHDEGYWGTRLLTIEEWPDFVHKGCIRVQSCGLGCALIHRKILEQIAFHYEIGLKGHSDIYFYNDCFRKRIPVFVDTNVICDHWNTPWDAITDR